MIELVTTLQAWASMIAIAAVIAPILTIAIEWRGR